MIIGIGCYLNLAQTKTGVLIITAENRGEGIFTTVCFL